VHDFVHFLNHMHMLKAGALVLIALSTRVGGAGPAARVPAFIYAAPTGGARAPGAAMCAPGPQQAPRSARRTLPACAQQRATSGTRCGVLALRAAEGGEWGWRQDTVERGGASSCARSRRAHAMMSRGSRHRRAQSRACTRLGMDINMPALCAVLISRRRCPREKQPDRQRGADFVKIHYSGFLEDGTQFEDTRDKDPLEFLVGSGRVVSGIDAAVEVYYIIYIVVVVTVIIIIVIIMIIIVIIERTLYNY
jgi:hypothetical protein